MVTVYCQKHDITEYLIKLNPIKSKFMKLRDIKNILNLLSDEDLNKELIYNSESLSISGIVQSFLKAKYDLYATGEDDPSRLYTKKQLKERGYDDDDIDEMDVEIAKGDFYITF